MMDPCKTKYMFSIKAGFPARYVAKTPAGYRIDVEYRSGQSSQPEITTDPYALMLSWYKELQALFTPELIAAFYRKYCDVLSMDEQHCSEEARRTIEEHVALVALLDALAQAQASRGVNGATSALGDLRQRRLDATNAISAGTLGRRATDAANKATAAATDVAVLLRALAASDLLPSKPATSVAALFIRALREYFEEADEPNPPWLGIEGHIVSGVDWALLRADGVMEFDGQLVLTDGPLDDKKGKGVLVNARTSGSVDLCPTPPRPYSLDDAVARLKKTVAGSSVGIALAIKFEAPQESEPWASKKYTRRKGQLKYVRLSRGQFIGHGKLLAFGESGAQIALNVFQVEVP